MRIPTETLVKRYQDRVYSAAFSICRNAEDARDITQETFLRYYQSIREFDSEDHIRAWLFRVAVNQSKDIMLSFWHRNQVPYESCMQDLEFEEEEDADVFNAVMNLPWRYRIVIHLFYYEDYSIQEISRILNRREGTVKSQLARGRKLLKEQLKEAWNENE